MPTLCVAVLVIVLQLACGDEAAVDPRGRVVLTRDGGRQEVVDSADVASALGERLPTGADLFRSALSAHLAAGPEALQPFAPPVIGPDGDELSPAVHEPAPAAPTADRPPIDPSGPELQPSSADESEGTLAAGAHLSRPRLAWLWADGDSEVERSDAGLHSVDGALGWRGTADESSLPAVGAHTVVVGLRRREDRLRAIKRELSGLPHVAPPSTLRMDAVDGTAELDLSSARDDGLLTHAAFLRARNQAPVHGVAPTRGAVGCYLSHAALWREARHRAGPLLVLEDDARLRSGAEGVIRSSLTQAPPDWSLILFGSATAAYGQFANAPVGALPLRRALVNAYGTFAYAVSPKGARTLWRGALPMKMQVDAYIVALAERSWRAELYALLDACRAVTGREIPAGDASTWFHVGPPSRLPAWLRNDVCRDSNVSALLDTPRQDLPRGADQRAAVVVLLGFIAAFPLPHALLPAFRAYSRHIAFGRGEAPTFEEQGEDGRVVEHDVRNGVPALSEPLRVFLAASPCAETADAAAFDSDVQTAPPGPEARTARPQEHG